MEEDDTVGVMVNPIEGTLRFFLNGEDQGIAFTDLNADLAASKYYFAVVLRSKGQRISMNPNATVPQITVT